MSFPISCHSLGYTDDVNIPKIFVKEIVHTITHAQIWRPDRLFFSCFVCPRLRGRVGCGLVGSIAFESRLFS